MTTDFKELGVPYGAGGAAVPFPAAGEVVRQNHPGARTQWGLGMARFSGRFCMKSSLYKMLILFKAMNHSWWLGLRMEINMNLVPENCNFKREK